MAEKDSAVKTTGAKPQAANAPARKLFALGIRESIPSWMTWGLGVIPIAVLLLAWFMVTAGAAEERVISPTILPSPTEVVRSFPELWFDRALMRNLMISLGRVIGGFGVGWSYILLAEMVDIGKGVGGLVITSQRRGPREHIYLILLFIVVLAFITDKLWATVERGLFPYRREGR